MFNYIYMENQRTISAQGYFYFIPLCCNLSSIHYLIINIGVSEWKIILRAILGLNKRAKTFRL